MLEEVGNCIGWVSGSREGHVLEEVGKYLVYWLGKW